MLDFLNIMFYKIFGKLVEKFKLKKNLENLEMLEYPYIDFNGEKYYSATFAKGKTYSYSVNYDIDKVVLFDPKLNIVKFFDKPEHIDKITRKPLNAGELTTYYYKCTENELNEYNFLKFVNTLVYKSRVMGGDAYHRLIRDKVFVDEYESGVKVKSWGFNHRVNKYSHDSGTLYDSDSYGGSSISTKTSNDSSDDYNGGGGRFSGSGAGSSWDNIVSSSGSSSSSSSSGYSGSSSSDSDSSSSSSDSSSSSSSSD